MRPTFPLTVLFPDTLSAEQAIERTLAAFAAEPLVMTFPVKPGNEVPQFPIALGELLEIKAEEGQRLVISPNADAFDRIAYQWNMALSQLPPKAVPRSQRLALRLIGKKLTAEPTGNPVHDYGRRQILNTTQKGIGPTIAGETLRRAESALTHATP